MLISPKAVFNCKFFLVTWAIGFQSRCNGGVFRRRAKTECPEQTTSPVLSPSLMGAYWCKTCHNYLLPWPPLLRILTGMLSGRHHTGSQVSERLFLLLHSLPPPARKCQRHLFTVRTRFYAMNYSREEPGLVRVSGYQKSPISER